MKAIKLNNGVEMPIMGYGVLRIAPEECERCVIEAIEAGYRAIDTAQAYYNEQIVGNAIAKCSVPRDELFITTKVWIYTHEEDAAQSIDESLRKLRIDYVDLLLVHQPYGDYYGTYRAMQKAYKAGKARAIGLSNFYDVRFVDLVENMEVKPAAVQLETNVFSQQVKMRKLLEGYDVQLIGWSPLSNGRNDFFHNKTLQTIGAKYGKDNAQVALKFLADENIIVIPKTVHQKRMASNLAIDDFELTPEDKEAIRKLDTGKPIAADHNSLELAKYLLGYDAMFNPERQKN